MTWFAQVFANYRTRRELAGLDDRLLADIGLWRQGASGKLGVLNSRNAGS